jgi:Tol biopolymer transport system component
LCVVAAALVVSVASAKGPTDPTGTVVFLRAEPPFTLDPQRSIVELDLASGHERRLARLPQGWMPTSWSPNFRRLALIRDTRGKPPLGGPLAVLDLATGRLRQLLRLGAVAASWSPDGALIAVAGSLHGRNGVILVDPSGRKRPRMIVRGGTPLGVQWSPDASKIMYGWIDSQIPYTCCGLKYVVDRQGRHRRLVVNAGRAQGVDALWAPDGRHIAYSVHGIGSHGLWLATSNGTVERQLTKLPDQLSSWSPDGSTLAVSRQAADGQGKPEFVLVRVDGSGERSIDTNTFYAAWSPDSRAIVYSKTDPTGIHLYLVGADGTGMTRLTTGAVNDGWPYRPGDSLARG